MTREAFIDKMVAKGKVTSESAATAKEKADKKKTALEKAKGDLNKLTKTELIAVITG